MYTLYNECYQKNQKTVIPNLKCLGQGLMRVNFSCNWSKRYLFRHWTGVKPSRLQIPEKALEMSSILFFISLLVTKKIYYFVSLLIHFFD